MKTLLESVGPRFAHSGFIDAQTQTRAIVGRIADEIRARIRQGSSLHEGEARKIALEIFSAHGVRKHWHQPWVRLGEGTTRTFSKPLVMSAADSKDHFFIDVGPVFQDAISGVEYEADYGDTFVVDPQRPEAERFLKLAELARDLFRRTQDYYRSDGPPGVELYRFLKQSAENEGVILVEEAGGHRISDFPHQRFTKTAMSQLDFCPAEALWILEVQIQTQDRKYGAFFEDVLVP